MEPAREIHSYHFQLSRNLGDFTCLICGRTLPRTGRRQKLCAAECRRINNNAKARPIAMREAYIAEAVRQARLQGLCGGYEGQGGGEFPED